MGLGKIYNISVITYKNYCNLSSSITEELWVYKLTNGLP